MSIYRSKHHSDEKDDLAMAHTRQQLRVYYDDRVHPYLGLLYELNYNERREKNTISCRHNACTGIAHKPRGVCSSQARTRRGHASQNPVEVRNRVRNMAQVSVGTKWMKKSEFTFLLQFFYSFICSLYSLMESKKPAAPAAAPAAAKSEPAKEKTNEALQV